MNLSIKILLKTCLQTLWKLAQLFLFIIIVPPLINYASLKREAPLLNQHGRHLIVVCFFEKFRSSNSISGLPYDIGYGQKLFLRCRGHGAPTG